MRWSRSIPTARPTAFSGMGDILSFIEKAEEAIDKKQAVEMQRKLIENDFTLEDFRNQLKPDPQARAAANRCWE